MRSLISILIAAAVQACDVDLKFKTLEVKALGDGYDPSLYKFGDACATGTDDDCAIETAFCSSADHCRWSWLTDDTPSGASAKCRCDGITTPIDPADYDFGDACATKEDDDCGIMHCPSVDHCRFSWAKDDPDKWNGKTAHCRCDETDPEPTPEVELDPYDPSLYKFGDACATGTDDDCAIETAFCVSADHCRWSWLTDDTPSGASAKCRCDGITAPIDPADYDFGDACATKEDDDCGIMHCPTVDHCRFSWAKDDPDKWNGKTAHCRCDETV